MIFKNNKVYDILKWVVNVVIPALATLILTIGQIWGFTEITVPVAATVVAVEAFLGALLGVSSIKYKLSSNKEGSDG